jgi:hypothetical protein
MSIAYEWDWEEVHIIEEEDVCDVIDHNHSTKLEDKPNEGDDYQLCLVRDSFCPIDGDLKLGGRSWAYLDDDGNLPSHFDGGHKIPKRFQKEFNKWKEKNNGK